MSQVKPAIMNYRVRPVFAGSLRNIEFAFDGKIVGTHVNQSQLAFFAVAIVQTVGINNYTIAKISRD